MCNVYSYLISLLQFQKLNRCYIDDLNDTLLELILLNLFSWKLLSTLKCVSKRWNEVISNPDFVRQFTYQYFPFTLFLRAKNGTCLITEHPYFKTHKFCLDFLPSNADDNIVAHYNDLVVIHREEKVFYIGNPLTKQFIVVPLPLFESDHKTKWWSGMVALAGVVDGVSSQWVNNLYHNNLGFRIVRIFCISDNINKLEEVVLQIYSSQTGHWITQPLEKTSIGCRCKGAVTFNNKVYWLGLLDILVIDPFSDEIIAAPHVINLPLSIRGNSILGLCQTRLRILNLESNYGSDDYPKIKVWELEDCGDDLTKFKLVINFSLGRYFIDSAFSFDYTPNFFNWNQMICCHPNNPYIVYFIYRQKVFCCDVDKPRLKAMSGNLELYHLWGNKIVMTHPLT